MRDERGAPSVLRSAACSKRSTRIGVAHPKALPSLERTSTLPLDKRCKRRFYPERRMEQSQEGPRGRLFVSPAGVAFLGRGLSNEPHKHFPASITLALEGCVRV